MAAVAAAAAGVAAGGVAGPFWCGVAPSAAEAPFVAVGSVVPAVGAALGVGTPGAVPFEDAPVPVVAAVSVAAAGSGVAGAVRARVALVAGLGAVRAAVARVPAARVPVVREVVRAAEARAGRFAAGAPDLVAAAVPVPVGLVFGVGSGATNWAAEGCSDGCSGAGDAAVDGLAGASAGDRPLPVSAERGAGVLRRLLVRVARRPFCPSTATTTLLPNAAESEAPTKMGDG